MDRTLPLRQRAADALRGIMLPCPEDAAEAEAWALTPIFRRADGTPWSRQTYRKAWHKVLKTVTEEHPRLAPMIVRDLRKAANTAMREAGTDPATAARLLGHSAEMNSRYVSGTEDAARRAILTLSDPNLYAGPARRGGAAAEVGAPSSSETADAV